MKVILDDCLLFTNLQSKVVAEIHYDDDELRFEVNEVIWDVACCHNVFRGELHTETAHIDITGDERAKGAITLDRHCKDGLGWNDLTHRPDRRIARQFLWHPPNHPHRDSLYPTKTDSEKIDGSEGNLPTHRATFLHSIQDTMDSILSRHSDDTITEEERDLITHHFNAIFTHEKHKGLNDFNGHFWVEKEDGTIIDDYDWDKEVSQFKRFFNIRRKSKTLSYERCDNELTNKVIIGLLHKSLTQGGLSLETAYKLFGVLWHPRRLCCMFNSVRNQYLHGGKIVFGCLFMTSDDGTKKHYISGGANFQTIHDFKKPQGYDKMTVPITP
jgi:hypothetical protein